VAHVRDGDHEPKPFACLFAVHGVVEIPRRFAVDGHEFERSQILPARNVARARHGRKLRSERLGLRRELERQFVFPERDLDLDPGIGGVPSTSTTRPIGWVWPSGCTVNSATTT